MLNLTTIEGHKLLVVSDPQGVRLGVIPRSPQLEDGVNDVFSLGLRFTSILRALSEMQNVPGYKTDDGFTRLQFRDGKLALKFLYQHLDAGEFATALSPADSQKVIGYLKSLTDGDYSREFAAIAEAKHPRRKVGRNELCPCSSGKKFKKCCGANDARPPDIPPDLKPFLEVEDVFVQDLIASASRDVSTIGDPDFWHALGRVLGTGELHDLAVKAFDRALKLKPGDELFLADRAVSIGGSGKPDECLAILLKLPNESGRCHILIANTLRELGRHAEAIPHYEKAIDLEPDFYLPYRALLVSLQAVAHPLYEYWINRAVRQFPKSPALASPYCWYLLRENRLEELGDADWIEHLEAEPPSDRVIGRRSDDPKLIVEAQLFRLIGLAVKSENAECLEKGITILRAAPQAWHLCNPAHNLARVAAHFGRRDLVVAGCERFCEECRSDPMGAVYVQDQLARASCVAGDHQTAVIDCEKGLAVNPDSENLLWTYAWSLDELGRTEDAIVNAQRLYKLRPDTDNLAYNVGYMSAKVGRLGLAVESYEAQLQLTPNHVYALENLCPILLMTGKSAQAHDLFLRWQTAVGPIEEPQCLERKKAKFESLHEFALQQASSPTLARVLKQRNFGSEPIFGAITAIPRKRATQEELLAAMLASNSEQAKELTFRFGMEKRGDFSPLAEQLACNHPEIERLPDNAYVSFLEGERLLDDSSHADYAPAVLAYAKTLEISLKQLVFDPFRKEVANLQDAPQLLLQAKEKRFNRARNFLQFIENGAFFELGKMAVTLRQCSEPIAADMKLLGAFVQFLGGILGKASLYAANTVDQIESLAKDYRNPSVHARRFDKSEASAVRSIVLPFVKLLAPAAQKRS
jgi:tetratricopeptide (TPR) repeat protein